MASSNLSSRHEADDDDDVEDIKAKKDEHEWLTRLCGSGARLWPHVSLELSYLAAAAALAVVAAILGSACTVPRCYVLGAQVSGWVMWAAFSCAISVPGRVIDKLIFAGFSALGEVLAGISSINSLFFIVGAFESSFSRLWWVAFMWTTYQSFLSLRDDMLVEHAMECLLVFQLLATGRQIALRLLMRNVLIGSFEEAINSALFNQLVLLAISKPPGIGPDGSTLPLEHDVAYNEVARMYACSDVRKKLEFIAKARFRMYSKGGDLQALAKLGAVEQFAKWAHKALSRLPESALRDLDNRLAEEISDSLAPIATSRRRTFSSVAPLSPPGGGNVKNRLGVAATTIAEAARETAQGIADRARVLVSGGSGQQPAGVVRRSESASGQLARSNSYGGDAGSVSVAVQRSDGHLPPVPESTLLSPSAALPGASSSLAPFAPSGPRRTSRALTAATFVDPAAAAPGPSPWAARGSDRSAPLVGRSYAELSSTRGDHEGATVADSVDSVDNLSVRQASSLSAANTGVPTSQSAPDKPIIVAPPLLPLQTSAPDRGTASASADVDPRGSAISRFRGWRGRDASRGSGTGAGGMASNHASAASQLHAHVDGSIADSVNSSHPLASVGRNVGRVFYDVLRSTLRAGLAATLTAEDLEAAVAAGLVDRSMVAGLTPALTPAPDAAGGVSASPTPVPESADGGGSAGGAATAVLPTKPPPAKLRAAHVAACMADPSDAQRAFNLLDKNGDGFVERAECVESVMAMFRDFTSLKRALRGNQSVSTAMQFLLDCVFWVVLASAGLWIFDVPVVQVYLPLGTVLVSASFAIGSSVSNVVSALIFVLLMRPYQVGDRVTCSDVFGGQETLLVMQIDVLTTTFQRVNNKVVLVPNHKLHGQVIENFKRSSSAAYKIELVVSTLTTARQLEQLRQRVDEYLRSQPIAWKPTCVIRAAALRDNNIVLSVWATSHFSWQEISPLFKAVLGLHMHLLAAMREGGIQFRLADQAVRIEGLVGARVLDAVTLVSSDATAAGAKPPGPGSGSQNSSQAAATASLHAANVLVPEATTSALVLPDYAGIAQPGESSQPRNSFGAPANGAVSR